MHRRELTRLINKQASLKNENLRHESDMAKAADSARRYEEQARKSPSIGSATSALNSAERERKKALQAGKKSADVLKKIADNARSQDNRRRSLESAEKSEQQARERKEKSRNQKEKSDRQTRDREDERRRQKEKTHAREITRLSAPKVHYVHIRPPEPEKLRVLYLTANAGTDLRTDVEIRQVQNALRSARFRDLVSVEQRPAATFQDLLDGLNDVQPHIVHFSGHGGGQSLVMDDGAMEDVAGNPVSFTLLTKALDATDRPPTLLVLNACDTLDGADAILPVVPVIIAMADAVLDTAAIIFAQQFYAALASGQSVGSALKQSKVAIEAATIEEDAENLPTCITREDIDVKKLILVKPSN